MMFMNKISRDLFLATLLFLVSLSSPAIFAADRDQLPPKRLMDSFSVEPQQKDYPDQFSFLMAWKCWELKSKGLDGQLKSFVQRHLTSVHSEVVMVGGDENEALAKGGYSVPSRAPLSASCVERVTQEVQSAAQGVDESRNPLESSEHGEPGEENSDLINRCFDPEFFALLEEMDPSFDYVRAFQCAADQSPAEGRGSLLQ